jgi:hypothetical protein
VLKVNADFVTMLIGAEINRQVQHSLKERKNKILLFENLNMLVLGKKLFICCGIKQLEFCLKALEGGEQKSNQKALEPPYYTVSFLFLFLLPSAA